MFRHKYVLFIIIIIITTSVQDIYSHIAETSHVPTVYYVAAILLLQYIAHLMQFPTINSLHCTTALSAVSVQCPLWLWITSFISSLVQAPLFFASVFRILIDLSVSG